MEEYNLDFFIPWKDSDDYIGLRDEQLFLMSPDLKKIKKWKKLSNKEFNSDDILVMNVSALISCDEDYLYSVGYDDEHGLRSSSIVIYDLDDFNLKSVIHVNGKVSDGQCVGVSDKMIFFTGITEEDEQAVFWLEKEKMLDEDVEFHVALP